MEYDIIIIGTTIDRITSAIYLIKSGKKVLLIESDKLKEYVLEFENIKDYSLKKYVELGKVKDEILELGGAINYEEIIKIKNNEVVTNKCIYKSKAIIIAMGFRYKLLGLENEDVFLENGIHFCISCDAPFYKDEIGCVVGNDEKTLESALRLSDICKKVIIINENDTFIANKHLIEKIYNKTNVIINTNTKITTLIGDRKLRKIIISNGKVIKMDCIFLSNGFVPNIEKINIESINDVIFVIDEKFKKNNENGISVAKKVINFINEKR